MRTTLDIPEDLLNEAVRASGAKTKTMAIVLGLKELVYKAKLAELRGLRGKIHLKTDLKKSRKR